MPTPPPTPESVTHCPRWNAHVYVDLDVDLDWGAYKDWHAANEPHARRCGPREMDSVRRYLSGINQATP